MKKARVAVIDLFAGAGGSATGARIAGADVRLSVEIDEVACATLASNDGARGGRVVQADVTTLSGDRLRQLARARPSEQLLVIGGPPCQPFSKAAYWTDPGHDSRFRRARSAGKEIERPAPITQPKSDDRRSLLDEFARLVIESRADAFMFENVPSIMHPRNRATFAAFRARLEAAGFVTTFYVANAAHFGVPQTRQRVVLTGVHDAQIRPAKPTHSLPDDPANGLAPAVSAGEAVREFRSKRYAEPEEVVKGRWARELREIPPGMNYKALTAWAGHANPVFEPETRFWSFLLKLHPNRPSWTIAANPGPWVGPFHWGDRRLRTVELAALQGFPAGYVFTGNRRERVRQIGNAMPPPLAAAMVRPILETLSAR
jgi:DNA (cytosine-5)-methyltransferase 1